jgi:hypothetical protein
MTLCALGLAVHEDDPNRAIPIFEEAISLGTAAGYQWAISNAQAGLANVRARTGDHSGALWIALNNAQDCFRTGNLWGLAAQLLAIALSLSHLGAYEAAAILYGAADTLWGELHFSGSWNEDRQQSNEAITRALGDARSTELHRRGEAMDDNQAIAFAAEAVDELA